MYCLAAMALDCKYIITVNCKIARKNCNFELSLRVLFKKTLIYQQAIFGK